MIAKLLFRLARSGLFDAAVRFGFAYTSGLLPVRRVCETRDVIAFRHPRPSWPRHILFVPKEPIASLRAVRPQQVPLVRQVFRLALDVASRERFERDGFVVLVNGGAYRDVGQLHVHLACWSREAQFACPRRPLASPLLEMDELTAYHHPQPRRDTHIVMLPTGAGPATADSGFGDAFIDAAIAATQRLVGRLNVETSGYTLMICAPPNEAHLRPCFHLVAGAEAR